MTTTDKYALQRRKAADRHADRKKRADDKHTDRERRRKRWTRRWATLSERLPFLAMLAMVLFCTGVAIPAQFQWFHTETHSPLMSIAAVGMLEGATWYFAVLYYRSVRDRRPNKTFHTLTLLAAALAATINFQHGYETNVTLGVVYAMGSVVGIGAFELYMMHTRGITSGLSGDELRVWSLRWRRFPRVMWAATRLRAVYGLGLPLERAWRMAYTARRGTPEVPVIATDPIVTHLTAAQRGTVEAMEAVDGGSPDLTPESGQPEVWNLPLGWDDMTVYADMFDREWNRNTRPAHPEHPQPEHPGSGGVPNTPDDVEHPPEHPDNSEHDTPVLPSQNTRNTPPEHPAGTPPRNGARTDAGHTGTPQDGEARNTPVHGRSATVPAEQNTPDLTPADERRNAVVAFYWQQWNAHNDDPLAVGNPDELTPADVLGALDLDRRSRPLVSKTLGECRKGIHSQPDD